MKYKLIIEGETFDIEINDLYVRPIIAVVNGEPIEVWPEQASTGSLASNAPLVPQIRPALAQPSSGATAVRAPIPGIIVAIAVREGDPISFGQELCTLEAMKMKSAIRASHPGVVKSIAITVGQTVRHQDLLLEITPTGEGG
jgi:biotin carboxyl carrier protein